MYCQRANSICVPRPVEIQENRGFSSAIFEYAVGDNGLTMTIVFGLHVHLACALPPVDFTKSLHLIQGCHS